MIQATRGEINLIRPTISFVGERSAAGIAESSKRARLSLISMCLASFPFKLKRLHDDPGYGLRACGTAAVLAMTIRAHARFALDPKANFSAIATAGDHDELHYPKPAENRAKDCVTPCKIDNLRLE